MEELREENSKLSEMAEKADYFADVIQVKNHNANIHNDDYTLNMKETRLLYTAVQVNAKSYLSFSCTCIEVSFMFIFNINNIIGLYIEIL